MRSVRFAHVSSLPNLLRNGGFDQRQTLSGVDVLPWWSIVGASFKSSGSNAYEIVSEETAESVGATEYARLSLAESKPVILRQALLADDSWAQMDFPVPLAPGSNRRSVPGGFVSRHEILLPRTRSYTFGAALRILRGKAAVSVRFLDANLATIAGADLESIFDSRTAGKRWRRSSAVVSATSTPAYVDFYLRSVSSVDFAEVHIGELQLSPGAYDSAPYTGDPSLTAVPSGAVLLSLGDACPPGYIELEDAGTAPDEWAALSGLTTRHGAFPYAAASSDADLLGAPTHNRDTYEFTVGANAVEAFESFEGKLGETPDNGANGYNPSSVVVGDEPDSDGRVDHQHNVADAGSLPGHRLLRFCRKI